MTTLSLSALKAALRVTHTDDDAELTRLLASATQEVLLILDTPGLTAETLTPLAQQAIILIVKADYDDSPDKRQDYRRAAEQLLWPLRTTKIS